MVGIIHFLRWVFASLFKSRERLKAENLILRHQVTVLRRSAPQRLRLRGWDRFLFVWLYRLWPSVLDSIIIVQPETVGVAATCHPSVCSPVLQYGRAECAECQRGHEPEQQDRKARV